MVLKGINYNVFTSNSYFKNMENLYKSNLIPNSISDNIDVYNDMMKNDSELFNYLKNKRFDSDNFLVIKQNNIKIGSFEKDIVNSKKFNKKDLVTEIINNTYINNDKLIVYGTYDKIDSEIFKIDDFNFNGYSSEKALCNNKVLNYLIPKDKLEIFIENLSEYKHSLNKNNQIYRGINTNRIKNQYNALNNLYFNKLEDIGYEFLLFLSLDPLESERIKITNPELKLFNFDYNPYDSVIIGKNN